MNKSANKLFYIITIPLWIVVYVLGIKICLKWDKGQYLEAQENVYVNNISPEAYYP